MKETEVLLHIPDDSGFEEDWFTQLHNDWENVGNVSTHMLTPSSPCSGVEPLVSNPSGTFHVLILVEP